MTRFINKILLIFIFLVAKPVFAELYPNGFSNGTLKVDSKDIPVKIYANARLDYIDQKLNEGINDNLLIILSDNNTDRVYEGVLNFFNRKSENWILYDKNFNQIDVEINASNLKELKYILKPKQGLKILQDSQIILETPEKTWDPKKGFSIGTFTVHYYSLMFVVAFVLGYILMKKMFQMDGVDEKYLDPLLTWTLIGTIFGARLGHVIFYEPELFKEDILSVFLPIQTKPYFKFTGFSGLASHGAAIMLILTTLYYSFKIIKKNPFWVYDRLGIVVALAGFFIRIGNYINSEILGKPVDETFPFAILFVQQTGYGEVVPRYPSQLFEAFGYICLFALLWYLYKKTNKKQQQGWLFGLFFVILWAIRFFVEFLKEPQGDEFITLAGLNTGQILSIPFILAGAVIMIYSKRNMISKE